jgi:long-subunit acyl-CoA synthetase (AMP-forming)
MKSTTEVLAPTEDLLSFAFAKQRTFDDSKPLYVSADDPRQSLSYKQTLEYVRQLISGLKAFGLADGDAVLVHLFNNVSLSLGMEETCAANSALSMPMHLSSSPLLGPEASSVPPIRRSRVSW